MVYVKTQLSEDAVIKTEISDYNVFTRCPVCGKELQIDINDLIRDGHIDLDNSAVYCLAHYPNTRKEIRR